MMIQIDYWSDYACPYCYIGEARLKKAAEETLPKGGWTLRMHSFELDPSAPRKTETDTATRFAHKYGLSLDGAKARIEDISSLGRAEGLDFRYATTRYTNTFDLRIMRKASATMRKPIDSRSCSMRPTSRRILNLRTTPFCSTRLKKQDSTGAKPPRSSLPESSQTRCAGTRLLRREWASTAFRISS